ncbi:MAG: MFS transporter [Dehalococcoidia bacterium]
MRRPLFYGWVIVGTLFMVNFATQATGGLNFGLFVLPMSADLGISRSLIGWVQTARLLAGGLSGFLIGRLLDRFGPRFMIPVASLVTGACLVTLGAITHVWQFIALFAVIGAMGLSAPGGSLLTSVPVAKWFVRQRGRAMALATIGLGIGPITFLPVTQVLITWLEWRGAWVVLAVISVSITVPLALLFLRRQPEDLGLRPDGAPAPEVDRAASQPWQAEEPRWTAGEALRTSALWKLTGAFVLTGFALGAASVHRIPYWVERGFDPQIVSYSFSADAAGATVMALLAGLLVERLPVRFISAASFLGMALSVGLMLAGSNLFFLFGSTVIFGLSVGANMIVQTFVWADYYGRTFLGTIRGMVLPAFLVSAAIGAPVTGYIYDVGNSYVPAWWLLLAILLLASLVMLTALPPRHPVGRPIMVRRTGG